VVASPVEIYRLLALSLFTAYVNFMIYFACHT